MLPRLLSLVPWSGEATTCHPADLGVSVVEELASRGVGLGVGKSGTGSTLVDTAVEPLTANRADIGFTSAVSHVNSRQPSPKFCWIVCNREK